MRKEPIALYGEGQDMPEDKIEKIGKIKLDLTKYPGEDLYCDGEVEDELLAIARYCAEVEYRRIIEERKSWEILYHLSPLREIGRASCRERV